MSNFDVEVLGAKIEVYAMTSAEGGGGSYKISHHSNQTVEKSKSYRTMTDRLE